MKNVRNRNSFIGNYFVYFKNTETVLTSTGKSDAQTFLKEILVYDEKAWTRSSDECLREIVTKRTYPPLRSKKGQNKLWNHFYSIPSARERSNSKRYMVVLNKEQEFDYLIKQIEKVNRSSIYIVDEHQQVMMSASKNHKLSPELLSRLGSESGYDTFRQEGESMILSLRPAKAG